MTGLLGHRQPSKHSQTAQALHRIELALCLLAAVDDPFGASNAAQQALSRIRVLAAEAGICTADCHRPEQLRALLQARKAQYQTEMRSTARRALDTAVLPGESWRVRSPTTSSREPGTHRPRGSEASFPDEST